jgi:hypothetical protein
MGTHSYKLENDAFVNVPNYYPPIEFKPDGQLLQRISELTVAVQSMQATLGRAFTQGVPVAAQLAVPAPQAGADMAGVAESVRQLGLRMDDLEGRVAKT